MLFRNLNVLLLLIMNSNSSHGFTLSPPPSFLSSQQRTTVSSLSASVATDDGTKKKEDKMKFLKFQRDEIAKKKNYLRGAGVFKEVKDDVTKDMADQFDSELMNQMKENPNYMIEKDGAEIYLAKEHGFCWGVERSINLAYSAVETFPDNRLHITNELIHNPLVNKKLYDKNVNFIAKDEDNNKDFSQIEEGDIVMLPAFGATLDEMKLLDEKGVKVVDTTCPWVSKVWNTVHKHQVKGLTSVIHGKYAHEETMATKSMCEIYLCVKNLEEAEHVADFILNAKPGDGRAEEFMTKFSKACSPNFDPHKDLQKIGLANQTTMYKKETRAIGQLFQKTIMKKFGPDLINEHYYEFDTICDATQVRQDAIDELCDMHLSEEGPKLDFILVVGGFDSSNTAHLLEIPQMRGVRSYHINQADCISAENTIRHRNVKGDIIEGETLLLPKDEPGRKLRIGVTSGASTPDKEVQDALGRIIMLDKLQENGELQA
mmetsp:Transcript_3517/g.5222  ORF Transcript_3517/g.5222 Transcript_3517/m.5222 type:complete len:487 (-) Transcript_3517:132-1592(-)|eukprot:CAMPEP_0194212046 /NCGR_PEP_ID=MMETSP0156-20130528/11594_1 /TAXON_ID=33649 /ORGANISM="Thalassionema nitzschioides, Strain L26-B" /LENGTH=486 /DNA_ID=CAMNT_0038939763 /DNA_START=84 /DNA_END=1544 /DNA_ORIENTATION=-